MNKEEALKHIHDSVVESGKQLENRIHGLHKAIDNGNARYVMLNVTLRESERSRGFMLLPSEQLL